MPRSVFIVAQAAGGILFERQFRYPTQMDSWEIPAGGIEPGEDSLRAAQRELQEETGYTADQWEHLGEMQTSNSRTNGMGDVYFCHGLTHIGNDAQTEEGITTLREIPTPQVMAMIATGQITDAMTLAPLMLAIAQGKI